MNPESEHARKENKGKAISFKPRPDLKERLLTLAKEADVGITHIITKCLEGYLPALEEAYKPKIDGVRRSKELLGKLRPPPKNRSLHQSVEATIKDMNHLRKKVVRAAPF